MSLNFTLKPCDEMGTQFVEEKTEIKSAFLIYIHGHELCYLTFKF